MTLQDLGNIGEFTAAVATLTTLIYLALQIRHNSRSVEAATHHSAIRARNELNLAIATSPELSSLIARTGDSLSVEEYIRFNAYMYAFMNLGEDTFIQYTKGLLTPENWKSIQWAMVSVLSLPGAPEWMMNNMPAFTEQFREEVTCILARIEDGDPAA